MPAPDITTLQKIFSGVQKHAAYHETVISYKKIKLHANGECPDELIDCRRPNESISIKDYRKKIYVPKTKNPVCKVLTELSKIRRSGDWSIKHPADIPASIKKDETLQKYCEEKFPVHESVENFMFTIWLKEYCLSGNSVAAMFPESSVVAANGYIKPVVRIFTPENIYACPELGYVVLQDQDVLEDQLVNNVMQPQPKKVFHVLDEMNYTKWQQIDGDRYQLVDSYAHNIGQLPAWKLKGSYLKDKNGIVIYDCRLDAMVASLDEAAREYSDLQAEVVQHIHSEKWVYTNTECLSCKSTGAGIGKDGKEETCKQCGGVGYVISTSPYSSNIVVTPEKGNEKAMPTPPVGYVQKGVEIVKVQNERVKEHLYFALSGVNMEYLAEVPLAQSGTAKTVDRESLNNFVYSVAEDLVWNMMRIYFFCNEYRNSTVISDSEKRKAMLPKVSIPQYFDLLGATYYLDKVTKATTAKLHPAILAGMEYDYVNKEFYNNPEIPVLYDAIYNLDPLPGSSTDEKMTMVNNNAITPEDYVISTNIIAFVKKAMDEDDKFTSKKLSEQKAKLVEYAKEKIDSMKASTAVIQPQPAPATTPANGPTNA